MRSETDPGGKSPRLRDVQVRRRVLAASVAVLAVVCVTGIVATTGPATPAGSQLLLGASEEPTPSLAGSSNPRDSASADPGPTGQGTAETAGPSATYHGRAVDPDGHPIAGLYLHGFRYLDNAPVYAWPPAYLGVRTADDGTFKLPCHDGYVVTLKEQGGWDSDRLSAVMLLPVQSGHGYRDPRELVGSWWAVTTPNRRPTFVGGGTYLQDEMHPLRCTTAGETTVVPPGAVLEGVLRVPAHCPTHRWMVYTQHLVGSLGGGTMTFYSTPVVPGERFRVTSLFPGPYVVHANVFEQAGPNWAAKNRRISVSGDETHEFDIVVEDDCGEGSARNPTLPRATDGTPTPEPEATPTAEATPAPEPAAS